MEELTKVNKELNEDKLDKIIHLLEKILKRLQMPLQTIPYERQIITKRQK